MLMTPRRVTSAGLLALVPLLAACSLGAGAVEAADLEKAVQEAVTPSEGSELTIECPDDLDAEVDATASCTVDDGEGRTGVRFTTTEVDGDEVTYETVPFLEADELERALDAQLSEQGMEITELDCPDDLDGVAEETTECAVASANEEGTVEVVVTEVQGLRVGFNWRIV